MYQLSTPVSAFNRPSRDQYRNFDRADLELLCNNSDASDSEDQEVSWSEARVQSHQSRQPDASSLQKDDISTNVLPISQKPRTKKRLLFRGFFASALKLTLCLTILLHALPRTTGAPVEQTDDLLYQENLARSKPFVIPIIIGVLIGWFSGVQVNAPLPEHHNRTTRSLEELTDALDQPDLDRTKQFLSPILFELTTGSLSKLILPQEIIEDEHLVNRTTIPKTPLQSILVPLLGAFFPIHYLVAQTAGANRTKRAIFPSGEANPDLEPALIHLAFMMESLVREMAHPVVPPMDNSWHSADLWLVFLAVTLNLLIVIGITLYFCKTSRIIKTLPKAPLNQGRDMKQDLVSTI